MHLIDFFSTEAVNLDLNGSEKDDILLELITLLGLDGESEGKLHMMLNVVESLQVAFGRKQNGVEFRAIDDKPVYNFFLIVAPPLEVSNQYLPVLGKIAQFAKEADINDELKKLEDAADFLKLLEARSS